MKVEPDFSEARTPNRPGTYPCKIITSELKHGQTSGAPYLAWFLMTYDGRPVYYNTPITGKGAGMFKHFVHAAGITEYESGPIDTDLLLQKIVSMKLALDDNNYFVVKEVMPLLSEHVKLIADTEAQTNKMVPRADEDDIPF